jgi:hypothetical protein
MVYPLETKSLPNRYLPGFGRWRGSCFGLHGTSQMVEAGLNMDQISTLPVARTSRSGSSRFLAIACLISYSLLAGLIVFQNRTIHIQRDLIHLLFQDRQHFTRPSAGQSGRFAAQNQVPSASSPQAQSSSPSSQVQSEMNSKTKRNSRKTRRRPSPRPPAQTIDPTDLRRVSISI